MAYRVCKLLWLHLLLFELGFLITSPMCFYCDNKVAINIAHNLAQHDRTKHIEVDHFIEEKLLAGIICIPLVKLENQLADLFAKGLGCDMFKSLVGKLGLSDIYYLA